MSKITLSADPRPTAVPAALKPHFTPAKGRAAPAAPMRRMFIPRVADSPSAATMAAPALAGLVEEVPVGLSEKDLQAAPCLVRESPSSKSSTLMSVALKASFFTAMRLKEVMALASW